MTKLATALLALVIIIQCVSIISAIETASFPQESKYLVRVSTPNGLCTGVKLNSHWVLTAAHCVNGTDAEDNKITLFRRSEVFINACRKNIIHPNYTLIEMDQDGIRRENDLALVEITTAEGKSNDLSVPLPVPGSEIQPGTVAITYSFGMPPEEIYDPVYVPTEVQILGGEEIQEALHTNGSLQVLDTEMFVRRVNESVKLMDDRSGCPMIVNDTLVGIQTRKVCAKWEYYLKVSEYIDWIKKTITLKVDDHYVNRKISELL